MKYVEMARAIGELTEEKNAAYGDSFENAGKVLEFLYPNGIQPSQYKDALGVVRVIDKLFRIATRKEAFGESPWKDIAGYGLLGAVSDAPPTVYPWPPVVGQVVAFQWGNLSAVVEAVSGDSYRLRFFDNSRGFYKLSQLTPLKDQP